MQTEILDDPNDAAEVLRSGGRVALPTETVYGLAARFDHEEAVRGIFTAKSRPADNPLIVHLAGADWLPLVSDNPPDTGIRLLEQFAPGPISVTVPRNRKVSRVVTAGLDSVAVRIPDHALFHRTIQATEIPLVAPSANRSGRPSPTTWQAALESLDGKIEAVLRGPDCTVGIESTVVDCCQNPPCLLRPGAIALEQLREVLPDVTTLDHTADAERQAASPGLRHRHYAPAARVELFDSPDEVEAAPTAMYLGLLPHRQPSQFFQHYVFRSVDEYAQQLFQRFHDAETHSLAKVYCQRVPSHGIGLGLMDRLRRAAES